MKGEAATEPRTPKYACWPRTWLFAPADQERKLAGALRSGAHAVIADLEDAVPPANKARARAAASRFVRQGGGPLRVVRVNEVQAGAGREDLAGLRELAPDAVMVPKATLGSVKAALESVPRVVALIESAVGVREADRIASLDGMIALALGGIDLSAELGLEELPNGDEFLFVRSKLALDGAANGVPVIDRVYPHITNEPGLKADTERARALGLRGKLCIHTAQVKTVAAALAPTSVQVSRARRIVETHQRSRSRGVGAEVIEGEMVDAATVRHAQRVLKEGTEAS